MSIQDRKNEFLLWDILIIIASIAAALTLSQTGILVSLLASAQGWELVGSFVAGLFFTSVFTTAPAIVALGEISLIHPLISVALFGAIGAVVGDLIIFRFIRDRFSEHLLALVGHRTFGKRMHALFKLRLFRWVSFFVGGLVIASPLPDELGISLLGFSKLKTPSFILLSFAFNFIGIVLIGLVAQSL